MLVLSGLVKSLLGTLDVLLHDLEQCFIGVQQELILFQVNIFRGDCVFAEICAHHYAEAISANDSLVKPFQHLHVTVPVVSILGFFIVFFSVRVCSCRN